MRLSVLKHRRRQGATALFLVIFAVLLFTVITVGFAQMMMAESVNSLDNVLSQSAYDSATAGVEDAKRTIAACKAGNAAACTAIDARNCNTPAAVTGVASGETVLKSQLGTGVDVNQAYTCVKINMNSPDYLRTAVVNRPIMIPLDGVSAVKRITIEWQQKGDVGGSVDTSTLGQASSPCHNSADNLCSAAAWGQAPALLEAQLITPASPFTLASLQSSNASGQTMLLRPFIAGGSIAKAVWEPRYSSDSPNTAGFANTPFASVCSTAALGAYSTGGYACSTSITGLSIPAKSATSYLRLTAIYRGANFRVTLYADDAGNTPVDFNGVQPAVDSTGRANDVFRRVESRLQFGDDTAFPLPQNAIDIGGSLCKAFSVTTTGVPSPGTCAP